jgi:hypothetical protein
VLKTQPKRIGAVRAALLFGTAAIAVAAILTPIAADRTSSARIAWSPHQFDNITTGSIPKGSGSRVYTVRKSILQDAPGLCASYGRRQHVGRLLSDTRSNEIGKRKRNQTL